MYEELVEALRLCVKYGKAEDALANAQEAADAIEELEEKCQALAETLYAYEHPWIPVTEEPSLKVGDDGYNGYLVYADGYYEVADYTTDKFDCVPYFYVNGEYEQGVTHYMPLPKPPKEVEE